MAGTATEPLVGRTAIELAAAVREGRASPQDVVEAHLEWIESLDRSIHAFQVVRPDGVREEARALASRADLRELPLAGVPVAIKDNLEMAGYATRSGTLASPDEPAASDDELVRRLRRAGAIPLGKTTVPELCLWPFTETAAFGATRKPWNLDHTPGGSSGDGGAGARLRRRRLDPHPRVLLRAGRHEAGVGRRAGRSRPLFLGRPAGVRPARHHRGGRGADARRAGGHADLPGGRAALRIAADRRLVGLAGHRRQGPPRGGARLPGHGRGAALQRPRGDPRRPALPPDRLAAVPAPRVRRWRGGGRVAAFRGAGTPYPELGPHRALAAAQPAAETQHRRGAALPLPGLVRPGRLRPAADPDAGDPSAAHRRLPGQGPVADDPRPHQVHALPATPEPARLPGDLGASRALLRGPADRRPARGAKGHGGAAAVGRAPARDRPAVAAPRLPRGGSALVGGGRDVPDVVALGQQGEVGGAGSSPPPGRTPAPHRPTAPPANPAPSVRDHPPRSSIRQERLRRTA